MAIEQQQQQKLFSTLMTVLREKLGDFRSKKKIFMHSGRGVARVNKVGGGQRREGGLGAKPPGKCLGPRPLLWRRTHLLIALLFIIIINFFTVGQ